MHYHSSITSHDSLSLLQCTLYTLCSVLINHCTEAVTVTEMCAVLRRNIGHRGVEYLSNIFRFIWKKVISRSSTKTCWHMTPRLITPRLTARTDVPFYSLGGGQGGWRGDGGQPAWGGDCDLKKTRFKHCFRVCVLFLWFQLSSSSYLVAMSAGLIVFPNSLSEKQAILIYNFSARLQKENVLSLVCFIIIFYKIIWCQGSRNWYTNDYIRLKSCLFLKKNLSLPPLLMRSFAGRPETLMVLPTKLKWAVKGVPCYWKSSFSLSRNWILNNSHCH